MIDGAISPYLVLGPEFKLGLAVKLGLLLGSRVRVRADDEFMLVSQLG